MIYFHKNKTVIYAFFFLFLQFFLMKQSKDVLLRLILQNSKKKKTMHIKKSISVLKKLQVTTASLALLDFHSPLIKFALSSVNLKLWSKQSSILKLVMDSFSVSSVLDSPTEEKIKLRKPLMLNLPKWEESEKECLQSWKKKSPNANWNLSSKNSLQTPLETKLKKLANTSTQSRIAMFVK